MICPWAWPNIGGVESHIEKLMQALVPRGYTITLVTYQPLTSRVRGKSVEHRPGITIYRFPWFGQGWFPVLEQIYFPIVFIWLFPGLLVGAAWILFRKRKQIDVIHAHGFIAAAIAHILSRTHRVRVVVSTHAIYHFSKRRTLRALVRWMLGSADQIICVGSPSIQELEKLGINKNNIQLLRNWVDLDHFYPRDRSACRRDLHIQGFTVLYVGRLIAKKGIAPLLAAAKALPDINFLFAGDGPEAATITKAAQKLSNVEFCDRVSDKDLPKYYTAADVFVQLALYEEGQAAVFLESIACGTPVIASRLGCAQDYLSESVAILIKPTTVSLIKALADLYTHPKKLSALQNKCRKYAQAHYSDHNVNTFIEAYGGDPAQTTNVPAMRSELISHHLAVTPQRVREKQN